MQPVLAVEERFGCESSCTCSCAAKRISDLESEATARSAPMMLFPPHAAALHLHHNQHKSYYRTVAQCVDDGDYGYEPDCWVSPDQMRKAIISNECWTLQWYPETPVGFCMLSAADLEVLLDEARKQSARC